MKEKKKNQNMEKQKLHSYVTHIRTDTFEFIIKSYCRIKSVKLAKRERITDIVNPINNSFFVNRNIVLFYFVNPTKIINPATLSQISR